MKKPTPSDLPKVLQELARGAILSGATALEFEFRDSHDEVMAMNGGFGVGIARLPSNSPDDLQLRTALMGLKRRRGLVHVGGVWYALRAKNYDSFGEMAFRLEIRRTGPVP